MFLFLCISGFFFLVNRSNRIIADFRSPHCGRIVCVGFEIRFSFLHRGAERTKFMFLGRYLIWSHYSRSSVTKKLGDATASAPWIGQGKPLISALNFTTVPDLAVNLLCQVKHPEPSVCLHRRLFVPTNRFYGHEMAVGWFDLATYQLVITFALAFHARPQAVQTLEFAVGKVSCKYPKPHRDACTTDFLVWQGSRFLLTKL